MRQNAKVPDFFPDDAMRRQQVVKQASFALDDPGAVLTAFAFATADNVLSELVLVVHGQQVNDQVVLFRGDVLAKRTSVLVTFCLEPAR